MVEKVDVIVVGAGPAGCSAAYALAKKGLDVTLVERGSHLGEKNVSGGVLFGRILSKLIPNFLEEAPLERAIRTHRISIINGMSALTFDYTNEDLSHSPHNGFSVIRSKFDSWFAQKAEEVGALLATGVRVDGVIRQGKRVVGIRAGDDEVYADVVIAADGANSILAEDAGLKRRPKSKDIAIGVKEVLQLSESSINERFNLTDGTGLAHSFLGVTKGNPGGGFLYTNKDTLSLGAVVHLSSFAKPTVESKEIMGHLKDVPLVKRMISGGQLLEYSAHLVPEGGFNALSKLYTDGFIVAGDAAGFVLNLGFTYEGMNYAIASGIAAAKAVLRAKKRKDFSRRSLRDYAQILNRSFVLSDLKSFKNMPQLLSNSRVQTLYPSLLTGLVGDVFRSDLIPRQRLLPLILRKTLAEIPIPSLIMDAIQVVRSI